MYQNFLIYSSANGHLGGFHVLAIVNSTAMNIGVHVSLLILVSWGYMPSSGTVGSYGSTSFSFLKNLHTVFHSDWANLHFHQWCTRGYFSPHSHRHLSFVVFFFPKAFFLNNYLFISLTELGLHCAMQALSL